MSPTQSAQPVMSPVVVMSRPWSSLTSHASPSASVQTQAAPSRTQLCARAESGWSSSSGSSSSRGGERAVRMTVSDPPAQSRVVLDLTHVHALDDVARRMMLEVMLPVGFGTLVGARLQALWPGALTANRYYY